MTNHVTHLAVTAERVDKLLVNINAEPAKGNNILEDLYIEKYAPLDPGKDRPGPKGRRSQPALLSGSLAM